MRAMLIAVLAVVACGGSANDAAPSQAVSAFPTCGTGEPVGLAVGGSACVCPDGGMLPEPGPIGVSFSDGGLSIVFPDGGCR